MSELSLGQIAKVAGYSRVRIYDFAVKGRIPGEPLRKPPEGQYRFEDTPALRSWCKKLRKNKPKAQPRRQASPRSASGRAARAEWEMRAVLKSGKADKKDLENALSLLESCRRLAYVPVFKEQPCTRGVLGIMAHFLMRSYNSRCENLLQMTNIHGALLEMLEAEKARTLPS